MNKFSSLEIAVYGNDEMRDSLLLTEGFFTEKISSLSEIFNYPVTVISDICSYSEITEFAEKGGFFILDSAAAGKIFNIKYKTDNCKYWECRFKKLNIASSIIELPFKTIWSSYPDSWTEIDQGSGILKRTCGKGGFIVLPFVFEDLTKRRTLKRKQFYAERLELPSERVASFSLKPAREILSAVIEFIYGEKNLPLLKKRPYPGLEKNLFLFRIDTDFASSEDSEKLNELLKKHKLRASWFIDTFDEKRVKNFYAALETGETGIHCYHHFISGDKNQIETDLNASLRVCKKYGISPKGYVAPFGEWYPELTEVLSEKGFNYSSEFAYDYDNFPSYPVINGKKTDVMQIPIHPVSPGRLRRSHFLDAEKKAYFRKVAEKKILNNEIIAFYHHPAHKMFDVLSDVFDYIGSFKLKNITFYEYYNFCKKRDEFKIKTKFENGKIFLRKEISCSEIGLEIIWKGKSADVNCADILHLENINFSVKTHSEPEDDYKKIYRFHWRSLLYDYESKKSKKYFERRLKECGYL